MNCFDMFPNANRTFPICFDSYPAIYVCFLSSVTNTNPFNLFPLQHQLRVRLKSQRLQFQCYEMCVCVCGSSEFDSRWIQQYNKNKSIESTTHDFDVICIIISQWGIFILIYVDFINQSNSPYLGPAICHAYFPIKILMSSTFSIQ